MWRFALALGLCSLPAAVAADASRTVAGTWTLEHDLSDGDYRLASRGTSGDFLICFDAGNVHRVAVTVGQERSVLSRGSCTVFAPTAENGIILGFASRESAQSGHGVALGTFRVILPPSD
ncbi:MAG: hypothetical protein HLUCCA24_02650 [Rhodobacteraceae bacterium HLUCCA24]|nr:MAG: hypothetical protein HLUCCA24_02650 [Rhodobacteraceae bacterium HLUCCA24]